MVPPRPRSSAPRPAVVAGAMGYGHLRAAHALAGVFGTRILRADQAPLAETWEVAVWDGVRALYEGLSRSTGQPWIGRAMTSILDGLTAIEPLEEGIDLSPATAAVQQMAFLLERGLCRALVERLARDGRPLVTPFYAPALAADRLGHPAVFCVITDTDLARIWVPERGAETTIRYLVPGERAGRRLLAYGVPPERVEVTGFPLPGELLGGPDLALLRDHLAARLGRLGRGLTADRRREMADALGRPIPAEPEAPPRVTFAVGGAGAQAELVPEILAGLAPLLRRDAVRLSLVAGIRPEVADSFRTWRREADLDHAPVDILFAESMERYLERFNRLLAVTDVLWTKPSEMTFFAALGLPLVLAPPVGVHEEHNRAWAREHGAAVDQGDPADAAAWLEPLLGDGTLAELAWEGFRNLPSRGLYRIAEAVTGAAGPGADRSEPGTTAPAPSAAP